MIATSVFLIPNGTFFVELIVVGIILFLVTKYILPPLNKAMESRQEKIRTALEAADRRAPTPPPRTSRRPRSSRTLVTRLERSWPALRRRRTS